MAKIDIIKLNQTLVNKLVKECKRVKCCKGEIRPDLIPNKDGVFTFEFENDGLMANDLRSIVSKDPRAICITYREYEGIYDWASDTYFKPSSMITYKF